MKTKQTITAVCLVDKPPVDVAIEIDSKYPAFGIGPNPKYPVHQSGKWAIFHLPTSKMADNAATKAECKIIIAKLAALGDWNTAELPQELLRLGARVLVGYHAGSFVDRPVAAHGLTSYRYRGRFGWVMIGARDTEDALREAGRSIRPDTPTIDKLQIWDTFSYVNVK